MITRELIESLHCPYCGSELAAQSALPSDSAGMRYGIIQCACYRYPIIEGIAILRQCSGTADTLDNGVACIERGDYRGALNYAFYHDSPIQAAQGRLQRMVSRLGLNALLSMPDAAELPPTFRQALKLHRPQSYGDYLFHRNANCSFLSAIPLLLLLRELNAGQPTPRTSLLDLNCGVGHASFLIRSLFPEVACTATDHDFVNLYLAKRYMIPDTPCLVMDAEQPLPFSDQAFDVVLCLDGLHYVRSKQALLGELDRCLTETAIWLFPHLHNALQHNFSAGVPLRPADYRKCFDFLPAELGIESDIFRDFMQDQVLDLSAVTAPEELDRAPVLSLVASRRPDIWRKHEGLMECMLSARSSLAINPIYAVDGGHLRMQWPTPSLERECEAVKQFLPEQYDLDCALWDSLENGTIREQDRGRLTELIKSFVLVPLPKNYA